MPSTAYPRENRLATARAEETRGKQPTLVGTEANNVLTLTQLATMEPQTLKALMKHRLNEELNWTNYQLAKAYGQIKEGQAEVNPSRYTTTVTQVLEKPETARWNTVCLVLAAMGLLVQVVAINQQVYSLAGPTSNA